MAKYPKLPKKFKAKWIKALRSGKYKQGTEYLKYIETDIDDNFKETKEIRYCCLGVACEIAGAKVPYKKHDLVALPNWGEKIRGISKLPEMLVNKEKDEWGCIEEKPLLSKLATMNDKGESFEQIADWIEKHL